MRHAAVIILLAAVVSGCGEDETTAIDVGPTGAPSLRFADPASGGGAVCVSIGTDANTRVPLLLDTTELVLHPPGACGVFAQCGHVALYAGGVANNESSVRTVELLLYKLGDRYHDGSPHDGDGRPDYLELRVEVLDDDGEPLLDHDDEPLSDELDLITAVDCDEL